MQIMNVMPLVFLCVLAVEVTLRLWPRLYDCGTERVARRPVRYGLIYPALILAGLATLDRLDVAHLGLLYALGVIAALDLAYHHISLPFQVFLVALTVMVIRQSDEPGLHLLAGLLIGGLVLAAALVSRGQVGLGDVAPLSAAAALAGKRT